MGGEISTQLQSVAEMARLNETIRLAQIAVDTAPYGSPTPVQLDYLGHLLGLRYASSGALPDLEESIALGKRAVNGAVGHPDRPRFRSNLVASLSDRYQRLGQRSDLDEAIEMAEAAVDSIATSHPNRAAFLMNLGSQYLSRSSVAGSTSDLNMAIQYMQQAVDAAAEDHNLRENAYNNLAIALGQKYERFGEFDDLEKSIQIAQIVVSNTGTDHPERARRLNTLANRVGDRYFRTKASANLDEAIEIAEQALAAIPFYHHDRPVYLDSLAILLGDKFLRSMDGKDLDRATGVAREALETTPKDHPSRAVRLNNLAIRVRDKYRRSGNIKDNEETIKHLREAIYMTGEGHPDHARWLYNLSIPLTYQYHHTKDPADLQTAIDTIQKAVIALPENHVDRAAYLNFLGDRLGDRYKKTREKADLARIVSSYHSALHQVSSTFLDRIFGGKKILQYYAETSDWQTAFKDATLTVNLIPMLTSRQLTNTDKQHVLGLIVGLACDAAAVALSVGKKPHEALSILEQGRGILATSLEEMRADVRDLQDRHPELATEYIRIRDILTGAMPPNMLAADNNAGSHASSSSTAGSDFEKLVDKIRMQVGFESFLLPPEEQHMKDAAKSGPIVVVNVSHIRCDAIIVQEDQIQSLPLPDLNKGIDHVAQKRNLGNQKSLTWLWDAIAKPVLDLLGFTKSPADGKWPHVWWIPTGRLSRFPLHAAGYQTKGSSETVLDRVMSSYASSVKSIVQGRQPRVQSEKSKPGQALLVDMTHTPGQNSLAYATAEIELVQGFCMSASLEVVKSTGLKADVLSHLPDCKIFHFAGHGTFNLFDPSKNALLLSDWKEDPLTAANLREMNLRNHPPFFAYLSACATGLTFEKKFLDESINVIGACQLAGFRHVVGTLWEVKDDSCLYMTETTYEEMISGDMTDEAVCLGLHKATRGLREKWFQEPKKMVRTKPRAHNEEPSGSDDYYKPYGDVGADVLRTAKRVNDNEAPPWVAYIHFGV